MFEDIHLANFPTSVKLFIGIFTTLMLCVCLWAILIFYVEQGAVTDEHPPTYLQQREDSNNSNTTPNDIVEFENEEETDFRYNVDLAHTHINGQTLLFFTMGLIFLFTSTPDKVKKNVLWIFGVSVFVHAIGLTGQHYHWFFDDILAISGVVLLVAIAYIALRIYVDLGKQSEKVLQQ